MEVCLVEKLQRCSNRSHLVGFDRSRKVIFTEISFSPETSILLQIIQIIHMTVGIIPESDSKGRAVCQFWLQGGKHNVTPTDKITYRRPSTFLGAILAHAKFLP